MKKKKSSKPKVHNIKHIIYIVTYQFYIACLLIVFGKPLSYCKHIPEWNESDPWMCYVTLFIIAITYLLNCLHIYIHVGSVGCV